MKGRMDRGRTLLVISCFCVCECLSVSLIHTHMHTPQSSQTCLPLRIHQSDSLPHSSVHRPWTATYHTPAIRKKKGQATQGPILFFSFLPHFFPLKKAFFKKYIKPGKFLLMFMWLKQIDKENSHKINILFVF